MLCSGLDSASSISLVNSLRKISQNGMNIVATLHQPRTEIFDLINMLYLLAPGGRVAYFGPAFGLNNHLAKLGFNCPPSSNISDYVMDVISGFVPPAWNHNATVKETVAHICDYTYSELHDQYEQDMAVVFTGNSSTFKAPEPSERPRHLSSWRRLLMMLAKRQHTFYIVFRREMKIFYRLLVASISPFLVLILMGVLIGNLFGSVQLSSRTLPSQVMSAQLAYAITIQPAALKLFYSNSLMTRRESDGGIALIPLYIGKLMGHVIEFCLLPLAFICGYYPFINAMGGFMEYFSIFLLLSLAVTGITNMCVIMFDRRSGTISSGLLIILWAVGGIEPTVSVIYGRLGGFGRFLVSVSMFRKSFEMGMLVELRRYSDVFSSSVNAMYDEYDIDESKYNWDALYLVLYWIVTNAIGIACMLWMRDNYRYWRMLMEMYFWPAVGDLLTSDSFIACEKGVLCVISTVKSLDTRISELVQKLKLCFEKPEETGVCDQYLQYLLAQPENSLDTLCKKCSLPIREHRREAKADSTVWTLSEMAKQRKGLNSSFMSSRDMDGVVKKAYGSSANISSLQHSNSHCGIGHDRLFAVGEEDEDDEESGSRL